MIDELESRLRKLSNSVVLRPQDANAVTRLKVPAVPTSPSRPAPPAIRISVSVAAAIIAILLANIAAAYFAPKYQRTLADSGVGPASQRLLAAVGLSDGDVSTIGDAATSAGHKLKLEAGYADGLRTVLFVSIDGRGMTGNPKQYGLHPGDWGVNYNDMTLTDQFGHSYGGYGTGGPTDLQFETLQWPASILGARLTLHITGIEALWRIAEQGPNKVIDTDALTTHADWTLHATLIAAPAHAIALPTSMHTAQAVYTFTSITSTETEMVLHWTVAGPIVDQMAPVETPALSKTDPFGDPRFDQFLRPHVYSEAGSELRMQDFGYTWPKTGPVHGEMTVFISGPGRYRIQIGTVAESWWVVVP
jgi:hypothetical protein